MSRLTPIYSANRMVREYVERCYLPAAAAYERRAADGCALGTHITEWRRALAQNWVRTRFGRVSVETVEGQHRFTAEVELNGIDPGAVRVELWSDSSGSGEVWRQEMTREERPADAAGRHLYAAGIPAARPASDYTARVVPAHADVSVPLEAPYILWQR